MRRTVAALVVAATVLLAGWAAPVHAETSATVELTGATVHAKGAAATVTFTINCPYSFFDEFRVVVTQAGTAGGETNVRPYCNGEPQTLSVLVLPRLGAGHFRSGKTAISGALTTCQEPGTCLGYTTYSFATRLNKGPVPPPTDSPDTARVVSATLASGGAAVRVVLDVTCRYDGNLPSVGVLISQRVGRTTTQSGADVTYERGGFLCIGAPQEVVLVVRVQPGQANFRPRRAFIRASVVNCVVFTRCDVTNVDTVRRLSKRLT
jgi:hypothetical protein